MRVALILIAALLPAAPAVATDTIALESGGTLSELDSRTLERGERTLVLSGAAGAIDTSPSGRRLAVADDARLRFVDTRRWRFTGAEVALPSTPVSVYFVRENRLLVVTRNGAERAAVHLVDPSRPEPLRREPLDHTPMAAQKVGDHFAVLDSDQRDTGELDYDVVRIYDARGRETQTVAIPQRLGDDETRSLIAFDGLLYLRGLDRYYRIDPVSGSRRTIVPAGGTGVFSWLAATRKRLTTVGRRGVVSLDRRTGRVMSTRRPQGDAVGFGAGWVDSGSGLTGYTAANRRVWRTLRGVDFAEHSVQPVKRFLYTHSSGRVRAVDKRTGRVVGRASLPSGVTIVASDADGAVFGTYLGDHGDQLDE